MKKISLILLVFCLVTAGIFAQEPERLMPLPANQKAGAGESLYVFNVKMRSGRSVILSIDDVRIGHFFNNEGAEIAVSNGRHVVRAHQLRWDSKVKGWSEDGNDRLTDTLNGVKYLVEVKHGPKLMGGQKVILYLSEFPLLLPGSKVAARNNKSHSIAAGSDT